MKTIIAIIANPIKPTHEIYKISRIVPAIIQKGP